MARYQWWRWLQNLRGAEMTADWQQRERGDALKVWQLTSEAKAERDRLGLDEDENELVELRDSRKQLVTKSALKFLTLSFVSVEESVFASQSFSDLFFFYFSYDAWKDRSFYAFHGEQQRESECN